MQLRALSDSDIQSAIYLELLSMGVKQLGLSVQRPGTGTFKAVKPTKKKYFTQLRDNRGLIELVSIYIACVQVVVGAIMARRQKELIDLVANSCLDETESWLIFSCRKSTRGVLGLAETIARPIDSIGVAMIKLLSKFQKKLKKIGYLAEYVSLFASPSIGDGSKLGINENRYNLNLDLFCDYFELALNKRGERYYLRQHMMRRFFALLFFYTKSYAGLDCLRWMLGHTAIKDVYAYIQEDISGATLNSAKARYVTESLYHRADGNYSDLAELLKVRYGTDDFTLLDEEEIEVYLTSMIEEGNITVEPVFLQTTTGEEIKIITQVIGG